MFRSRIARIAAVTVAAALTLSACQRADTPDGDRDTDSDQPAGVEVAPGAYPNEPSGDPVSGGTLTYADLTEVRSLDPSMVISTGASGGSALVAVYDQLVRYDVATGEYQPRLAESIEPNDDFTEWTIKVRPDMTFSDGTPVNADAVVGSLNWYTGTQSYEMALLGPLWGGVEKIDDMTLKITLNDSWATFEGLLARSPGFIVAPAAIEGGTFTEPIGAGAFTFDTYAPGEELILKANPDHWDGAPYVDELRFVWLGADQTRYESLQGGSIHAAYVQEPPMVSEIFETEQPHVTTLSGMGQLLLINQAPGNPGEYPAARKAMAHALDADALNERVHGGYGYAGKLIFPSFSQWYDDSVEINEYDVEAASQALEEAKAEGYDGKVELLGTDTPSGRETMLLIQGQLEAAGFEVETELVRNVADYITRLYVERNYSVTASGLSVQEHDPWVQLYLALYSTAPSNIMGTNDPEMDALLDELRTTPIEDAGDVVTRIEQRVQDEAPVVNYLAYTPTIVWSEDVYGVIGVNDTMMDFSKAWIAE